MSASPEASSDSGRAVPAVLRRFVRNRRGSTSIEFAVLALPFFVMMFAILEICISFGGQQVLTNATDEVARLYRTGQIKPTGNTETDEAELRRRVCDYIDIIVASGCPGLTVDLRSYTTFAEAAAEEIAYPDQDVATPGLAGSKNMLRVYNKWPVITDLLQLMGSKAGDGTTMHFAVAIWQNEPFND